MHTHAKTRCRIADAQFHIRGRARVGARSDGVLVVVHDANRHVQRIDERRDGPVAFSRQMAHLAVFLDFGVYAELLAGWGVRVAVDTMTDQFERLVRSEETTYEIQTLMRNSY